MARHEDGTTEVEGVWQLLDGQVAAGRMPGYAAALGSAGGSRSRHPGAGPLPRPDGRTTRLDRAEGALVERVVPAGPAPAALVRVSALADGSRLWFAIAAGLALRPRLRRAAGEGLAAALLAAGGTRVLGRLVRRPRPAVDHPARRALVREPTAPSFPSSHTAVAVAFTAAVARHHPRLAAALAPLAGTLAYGRVRLRVHWPTDVLGGVVVGVAAARSVRRVVTAAGWAGSASR